MTIVRDVNGRYWKPCDQGDCPDHEHPEDLHSHEITRMLTVVYELGGRMYPCKHMHVTEESARTCVDKTNGISIIEWVKDRTPQFAEFWRRP